MRIARCNSDVDIKEHEAEVCAMRLKGRCRGPTKEEAAKKWAQPKQVTILQSSFLIAFTEREYE
jgi:hypothetical protein